MMPLAAKIRAPTMTGKQVKIMRALLKRNADGSLLDVYQLLETVAPGTSRGGMLMSLRHLHTHGFIDDGPKETRRCRCIRTFQVTPLGIQQIRGSPVP